MVRVDQSGLSVDAREEVEDIQEDGRAVPGTRKKTGRFCRQAHECDDPTLECPSSFRGVLDLVGPEQVKCQGLERG